MTASQFKVYLYILYIFVTKLSVKTNMLKLKTIYFSENGIDEARHHLGEIYSQGSHKVWKTCQG